MDGVVAGSTAPRISWLETEPLALQYGPKGARLLTLPRSWTPPFVLVSNELTERLLDGSLTDQEIARFAGHLTSLWSTDGLIVRSSVLGETIWERGTFHSEVLLGDPVRAWQEFLSSARAVRISAPEREVALVIQTYVAPEEQGEFGNLSRVSKTRDHWQYSVFGNDAVLQNQRYNSQRDVAPSADQPLLARPRLPKERLFGSIGAWINNDLLRGSPLRVNCEWVRKADRFYVVQIDGEDEDVSGVNPLQVFVEPSIPTGGVGRIMRSSTPDDRRIWDKLAVLDELYDSADQIVPTLFVLEAVNARAKGRAALVSDFQSLIGTDIVVRVSVRAGEEKLPNLPKTDCVPADVAADWCIEASKQLKVDYPGVDFAFIAHRFIGSRSAAWARADPNDPVVEVHGTWGLPDALQLCPYDIWDVHVPAEEITEYPAYKSDVLLKLGDGRWGYQRVKNEVARFQSLSRQEVLDVAARTLRIAERLGRECHVMWFVGCRTNSGLEANLPWYWTEAHPIALPEKRSTHLFKVENKEDLQQIEELAKKYAGLGIVLAPKAQELLRNKDFLEEVASIVVPLGIPIILEGSALAHAFFQLQKNGCVVIPAGDRDHVRSRKHMSYAKLVRDKIPDRIASQKEKQTVTTIPSEYRLGFLIGKMIEESLEVREAPDGSTERLLELADIFEVVRALAAVSNEDITSVVSAADQKRETSGGFDAAQLLMETSIPAPGEHELRSGVVTEQGALLVEQVGPATLRLPFTFLGFAGLESPRAIRLEDAGLVVHFTLKRDCLEIVVSSDATQLSLDL